MNKAKNERPGSAFKLPSAKFDTDLSISRTELPIKMNKQCNSLGLTKLLHRSDIIESEDSNTDRLIANLNPENIINN